jgi:DNA topoisomerase-1
MSIAEKLYMAGLTSYPRTDNTVYPESLDLKEILRKLESNSELGRLAKKILGQKKLEPVRGKRQATDHPPIHPVESADKAKLSKAEWKVYELIARRFLATLATPSEIETVKVLLDYGRENFVARGKTVLSGGWREFYPYSKVEEELLPKLAQGDIASVEKLECHNDETKPKPRYTPATLIKILEDKNLGTKATRAEILQKLIDRGYIQGRQNFTPSQIAFAVIDALEQYSPDITKADMTAKLETEMDLVEQGRKEKDKVVAESRKMLHKVLKELLANQPRVSEKLQVALREDVVLGKCQLCGGNLRMIETPRGTRFVGCSNYSKGCKNSFPLPAKGRIKVLGTACATCGLPMIEVAYFKRRPFQMCINHKCASKAGWKKKGEKK